MARRIVEISQTGERLVFEDSWNDSHGRVMHLEYVLQPNCKVAEHHHPATSQSFEVLSGTLHVRVNGGDPVVLNRGDQATTGVGGVHAQWNEGPDPVTVRESYDPPLNIEPFFTVLPHAMATKNLLKRAVFASDFDSICAVTSKPAQFAVAVLAPLGRLFGLAHWYESLLPHLATGLDSRTE
jgi:mannose-6-phosphate isomerase-like protein (cupin superfamily)